LGDDAFKDFKLHDLFIAQNGRTKAALKIADIADLDIYFLKSFADIKNQKQERYLYVIKTGLIWTKIVVLF
jgi:hypothetical protein